MKKLALIGGNPKGFAEPFHPSTLSGKRLHDIITRVGLSCLLVDMTKNSNDVPSEAEINDLKSSLADFEVVFLGRFVERRLRKHFPNGMYLPHPASRRLEDLRKLEQGLLDKKRGSR